MPGVHCPNTTENDCSIPDLYLARKSAKVFIGAGDKPKSKWKGGVAELGDNLYALSDARKSDQYTRTTEAIQLYVQREYKIGGKAVATAMRNLRPYDVTKDKPTVPKDEKDAFEVALFQQQTKTFADFLARYKSGMEQSFSVVLGQCTPGIRPN
jgi:hypothetical protein